MTNDEQDHLHELTNAHDARAQQWREVKADPNCGLDGLTAAADRVKQAEQVHQEDLDEWRRQAG
ncbi:hypothetical protein [Kitasatospora sp. NPDC050543]|uniref:hypothetical protein n=1 Tax=Kitasatospora sp. NPDC050543 TaxID=3364054 RepID=UPI0037B8E9B5